MMAEFIVGFMILWLATERANGARVHLLDTNGPVLIERLGNYPRPELAG